MSTDKNYFQDQKNGLILVCSHLSKQKRCPPKPKRTQLKKKGTGDHEIIILTPAKKTDSTQTENLDGQIKKSKLKIIRRGNVIR